MTATGGIAVPYSPQANSHSQPQQLYTSALSMPDMYAAPLATSTKFSHATKPISQPPGLGDDDDLSSGCMGYTSTGASPTSPAPRSIVDDGAFASPSAGGPSLFGAGAGAATSPKQAGERGSKPGRTKVT